MKLKLNITGKLLILLTTLILQSFFMVTNNVANDFSYLSKAELLSRFTIPQIWQERISEGFGQYSLAILWNWPMDFLFGLLGKLGLNFASIEILLFLLPYVFVGHISIKKFLNYFRITGLGEFAGILLYLLNPYVILLIDGGQLSIALAYSLVPLVFISFIKALGEQNKEKLYSGLLFWVLGFLDIRYVYLCALIIATWFLLYLISSKNKISLIKDYLLTGLFVVSVFVLLNLYWLLPALFARAPSLPEGYSDISQLTELGFTNWKHAVLMQPANWFKNVFGNVALTYKEFLFFPVLMLLGVYGLKKNLVKFSFFIVLTILGIFLSKGATYPLGEVYNILFTKTPGFSLFRDSTKFFIFTAIGYSYFIGSFIESISYKFKGSKLIYLPLSLFLFYLIFIIRPVWLGQMTGTLAAAVYEGSYQKLWSTFENDNDFGRVLWIPAQSPLGYSSPIHPSIELSRLFSKRPFSSGVVGSYETSNFLREASYMGEIFDVLSIKYIVYPYPDERREDLKPDNVEYYHSFSDQIGSLGWIENKVSDFPVNVYKAKVNQDRFFIADNTWIVVGDDDIYQRFGGDKYGRLFNNALIFAEEQPSVADPLNESVATGVVLENKENLDYALSSLPSKYFVFPSVNLSNSPGSAGWWKRDSADFLWMRNFMQQKYGVDLKEFDYGGGYAISEGNNKLQITNNKLQKGDILFARVLKSSRGGNITFTQNGTSIGDPIYTQVDNPDKVTIRLSGYKDTPDQFFDYDQSDFSWINVGKLENSNQLTTSTSGEINVINALVSVPEDDFNKELISINEDLLIDLNALPELDIINMFESDSVTNIEYKRLSSTHYEVMVEGLTKPSTLVFSETYDPLWRIYDENGNEGSPYKLYNLINGFSVEKDGVYKIYFTPQRYVNYGLIVSILGVCAIASYLLFKRH